MPERVQEKAKPCREPELRNLPVSTKDWSCRLVPLELVQVGGGDACGLTTGAKALFCFTADTILAGEKEKIPEELLQLDGRLVEEAIVGLDGTMA